MNKKNNLKLEEQLFSVGSYVPFICHDINSTNSIWQNKSVKTAFGVEIYTNSDSLHHQLEQYVNSAGNHALIQETKYKLYYSVDLPVPFYLPTGIAAQMMEYQKRADMAVDTALTFFAVAGPNKFGSAISMAYGIRALHAIDDNQLGLHAAGIIDLERKVTHILTGDSGIGKTSLALRLEQEFPKRFVVFCDDWLEVCLKSRTVHGISQLFGANKDSYLDSEMKNKFEKRFTSFNKNFYFAEAILRKNTLNKLGNIFNIQKDQIAVLDEFAFRSTNHHIPFINQTSDQLFIGMEKYIAEKVSEKISTILNNYKILSNDSNSISIFGNHEEKYIQLKYHLV